MGARVIQPCNSSNGFKPNNKSKKEISADVWGGKHANKILREVWCHLIWTKLSQLPGTKSERNSEWGGGKRKLGVCWSSLSTAGRGVMSTERDWNGLFLGLPPCPLAHIQSCIIHTLHYLSAHPSQSTTAGPSCTVPIRTFFFFFWIHGLMSYADGWERREVGGSLSLSYHREDCRRKWLHRLLSPWFLQCAIVL